MHQVLNSLITGGYDPAMIERQLSGTAVTAP